MTELDLKPPGHQNLLGMELSLGSQLPQTLLLRMELPLGFPRPQNRTWLGRSGTAVPGLVFPGCFWSSHLPKTQAGKGEVGGIPTLRLIHMLGQHPLEIRVPEELEVLGGGGDVGVLAVAGMAVTERSQNVPPQAPGAGTYRSTCGNTTAESSE